MREILDSLDNHENQLDFLNENPWDGQANNEEVRLYEQFCVHGGVATEHLRATMDMQDSQGSQPILDKPHLNQRVMATYNQASEGVLNRSREPLKPQDSGLINLKKDSEDQPYLTKLGQSKEKPMALNIMVQGSDLSDK